MNKSILIAGCSFTADSGFTCENFAQYHYTSLLEKTYPIKFNNVAIGGMSNREISLRVIENFLLNCKSYDAVIVQWSTLARWWFYRGPPNIDDHTTFNSGGKSSIGFYSDFSDLMHKLLYTEFDNQYVLLKQWLLDCIMVGEFLKNKVPYTFCLGFNNWLSEFESVYYDNGFHNVSEELMVILDLHNRPDSYILEKVTLIKDLILIVKQYNWSNFINQDWVSTTVDLADDNSHPGIVSNSKWATTLEPFILTI